MPYVPDATNVAEPVDTEPAASAAAEFRTLKTYIRDVVLAGLATKANLTSPTFNNTVNLVGAPGNNTLFTLVRATRANFTYIGTQSAVGSTISWALIQKSNTDNWTFLSNNADVLDMDPTGPVSIKGPLQIRDSLNSFGLLYGRNGGSGLGRITLTTVSGIPSGTSPGDLTLVYTP